MPGEYELLPIDSHGSSHPPNHAFKGRATVSWFSRRLAGPTLRVSSVRWIVAALLLIPILVLGVLIWSTNGHLPHIGQNESSGQRIFASQAPKSLKALCDSRQWHEGLYLVCHENRGGVGNIATQILDCVRYAIEAGASITMPMIERRGESLGALKVGKYEPMSYMFDEEWFRARLAEECPNLRVLEKIDDIPSFATAHIPDVLAPLEKHSGFVINEFARGFPEDLAEHLNYIVTSLEPAIVRIALGPFEWPVQEDSLELYASFGRIIKFRDDVRQLATHIVSSLNGTRYLGAHMRTDTDVKEWILPYEEQRDVFITEALTRKVGTVYVASGSDVDMEQFKSEAMLSNLKVFSKRDLLDDRRLGQLAQLTWDQQALVDYLVLRNSTFFTGISPSSFSFALAYARHLDRKVEAFPFPRDAFSYIAGANSAFYEKGLWPI